MIITDYIFAYIQYKEVFSDNPLSIEEIKKICSELDKNSFLELLCKINIALWKSLADFSLQIELAQIFFSKEDSELIIKYAQSHKRFIFYRQQILYLIKLLLSAETANNNTLKHANPHKNQLGKILLSLSYFTEPIGGNIIILLEKHEQEKVRQSFARQWYFIHSGVFEYKIARSLTIWLKIPRTKRGKALIQNISLDPKKEFYKETGLSISEFIGFAMTILGPYWGLDPKTAKPQDFLLHKEYFFSKTKISEPKKNKIFNQLFLDKKRFCDIYKEFVKETLAGNDVPEYNFLPLEDKPLLELANNQIIPIDPNFLINKVTEGVYWILLNRFKRLRELKKGRGRELSKYYGYLIQEYVYQILINVCDEVYELLPGEEKTADFIGKITSNNKNYLIVVDSKKIALRYKTLILSDKESTSKDLAKIFGNKYGFKQIYETIRRLRLKQIEGFNIDIQDIHGIFPILITDREIFEDPLNRLFYEKEFLIKHKNSLIYMPTPLIFEPIFICLDEMEIIEACCNSKGKDYFIELLGIRNNKLKKRITSKGISNIPKEITPLWNHLFALGFTKYKNQKLTGIFIHYYKKIAKKLFGKELKSKQNYN